MTRRSRQIDADDGVKAIARSMGVAADTNLSAEICDRAEERVARWLSDFGIDPPTLDVVHELVLNQTRLEVVRVEKDADLASVAARLRREVPAVQVQLEFEFAGGETEALVLRRDNPDRLGRRFTAVVDAREGRRARAWFGAWHEPSHLLVDDPAGRAIYRRTRTERPEPVEQVIDAVAARVGFWSPIVEPALKNALTTEPELLHAFEATRALVAPQASIEACYRAFARLVSRPIVVVRCEPAPRASERGLGSMSETYALRATRTIENEAARAIGMRVWRNYRVPDESVIAQAHEDQVWRRTYSARERLGWWEDSSGRRLRDFPVHVTARGSWAVLELAG